MSKEDLQKAIKDTIIKYKEIIFNAESTICTKSLNELRKQQLIDERVYNQKLMKDTMRKLAWDILCKTL